MRLVDVRESQISLGSSALRECLRGIEVFLNPSHHAEQTPWVREARRRLPAVLRAQVERFRFFFEPAVETFAFAGWDQGKPSFQRELAALRCDLPRYRDAVVKRLSGERLFTPQEMRKYRRPSWYRRAAEEFRVHYSRRAEMLEEFVESPARSLKTFCTAIDAFHAQAIEHCWGAIALQLASDIAMRRRILREHGLAALIRTLTREVSLSATKRGLTVNLPGSKSEIEFGEAGSLLLTPSFFCWPHPEVFVQRTRQGPRATIAYPIPALPMRTQSSMDGGAIVEASKALADPVRLRILELLRGRDLSTRELAGFLSIAEPVVSKHLKKLRGAGLVKPQRSSYFVIYRLQRPMLERLASAFAALQ